MEENKNTIRAIKELRKAQREISDLPPTPLMCDNKDREKLVAHMLRFQPYPMTEEEKGIMAKMMVDALEWGWRTSMTDAQYQEWKKECARKKELERLALICERKAREKEKTKDIRVIW